MTRLLSLTPKGDGFHAVMYDRAFGGFAQRDMPKMSRTKAIKDLRSRGVVCPKQAYTPEPEVTRQPVGNTPLF